MATTLYWAKTDWNIGWICDPRNINGQWLVCFDHVDDLPQYPIIAVKEKDLKVIWESPE